MKKTLCILLVLLLILPATGLASMLREKNQFQPADLSALLDLPGFTMTYGAGNAPQWFSYEQQLELIDDNGCYVIPCFTAMQTELGDFMALQLDMGYFATADSMIGLTEFSVLVDAVQYTFTKPQLFGNSAEEYGMILCGQEGLAMLERIFATKSPVHVVLKGEKGRLAYAMTELQKSVLQTLVEAGKKAGLFENDMALGIVQSFSPVNVSSISPENKKAVAKMGSGRPASDGGTSSSQDEPQVDYSVFDELADFTVIREEYTGNFAVYSTDAGPLYTREGYLFEPLIGSFMAVSGYAPVLTLSLSVDEAEEFTIHEVKFILSDTQYTFSPSKAGNVTLSNVFRISCGKVAQRMLTEIFASDAPVEIKLTGETDTVSFVMPPEQKEALRTLYNAYMASGAAEHHQTLLVAEELSPVFMEVMLAPVIPLPTIKPTTDTDLPADAAPFQSLPGIVTEKDEATGQYRFLHSNPASLMGDSLSLIDPYVALDVDTKTGETGLRFVLAASSHKRTTETLGPASLRFVIDDVQYDIADVRIQETDTLVNVAMLCGANGLELVDAIIASKEPVIASIICVEENIDFTIPNAQIDALRLLYDAFLQTSTAQNISLLRQMDAANPITITDASGSRPMRQKPLIQLDTGETLEDQSFIIHYAPDNKDHYTEDGFFLEPVFVYDAEEALDLFFAIAVGQESAATPPDMVTFTIGGTAYPYPVKLSKGYLHLTYALIPCGENEFALIEALLASKAPATITLTTKGESGVFTVTEQQRALFQELVDELESSQME